VREAGEEKGRERGADRAGKKGKSNSGTEKMENSCVRIIIMSSETSIITPSLPSLIGLIFPPPSLRMKKTVTDSVEVIILLILRSVSPRSLHS